jgi:phosphatidylglycerol:prolipoprotein diacylglycerol transferase
MHPILFEILGFPFYGFGLMLALAFVLGLFWVMKRATRAGMNSGGMDSGKILDTFAWVLISSIVGARLCFILFFPDAFWADPLGVMFSSGGLVWYGGMIGVVACVVVLSRLWKFSALQFLDVLSPPAALGLALGRIGCFLAGCCYGAPTQLPIAVHFPLDHETHGVGVLPVQLFESTLMFMGAFLLGRLSLDETSRGKATAGFLMLYGLVRFSMEAMRGDRLVWLPDLNLSASQCISLLGLVAGVILWRRVSQKSIPPVNLA